MRWTFKNLIFFQYNDVAVLTLDRTVTTTNTIQPICINTNEWENLDNRIVEVSGWGVTSAGSGTSSDVLRKVKVKVWRNSECASSYGSDAPGGIKDTMVCASIPETAQDSCSVRI